MSSYRKGAQHKFTNVILPFVFIPKYRKSVLRGDVGQRCRHLIREICGALDSNHPGVTSDRIMFTCC